MTEKEHWPGELLVLTSLATQANFYGPEDTIVIHHAALNESQITGGGGGIKAETTKQKKTTAVGLYSRVILWYTVTI